MKKINAGSYVFNDALTRFADDCQQTLPFIVSGVIDGKQTVFNCYSIQLIYKTSEQGIEDYHYRYGISSIVTEEGTTEINELRDACVGTQWKLDIYKIITIPQDVHNVSDTFYSWFSVNTRLLSTVSYGDSLLANLLNGQTAVVKCKDQKMEQDLIIKIGESRSPSSNGLPTDVSTEQEMNILLETAEEGSVYRYVGPTTNTYENGTLYIVEVIR